MRLRITLLAILVLFAARAAITIHAAQKNDTAKVMFEAAKKKELVDGDLNGAIQQYKAIVTKFKEDRTLAADALIRMADCYQKLGDAESHKIYEQILRDYADQKEALATARERLRITAVASMTSRQVARVGIGGVGYGSISRDGRYFPHTNWTNGDLYIRDLMNGTDRRLTNVSGLDDKGEFAVQSTFSRDGKQVAYGWFNGTRNEIRIVSAEAGGLSQPRRVFINEDVSTIFPDDWSSDGKWLAVQLRRDDRSAQIGLIALQDGSLHVLKSIDWRGATRLMFSPDSKYLAYDLPVHDKTNERDVFVLSVDGAREVIATNHPSNDVVMGWAPAGDSLLFASDRSGQMGLWKLRVQDGNVSGAPEAVKTEIAGAPLGTTNTGGLYFLVHHPSFNSAISSNIQIADFDFVRGKLLSQPVAPVQSFLGANNNPRWSRDGKYLAYVSSRPELSGAGTSTSLVIGIRSVETGEVRELRPSLNMYPATVEWSADGLSLFTQGRDLKGRQGIYRIEVQTGDASPVAISNATGAKGEFRIPEASPDGKKLYFKVRQSEVVEVDLATGNRKTVLRDALDGPLTLSPNGQYLATTKQDSSTKTYSLLLVNVTNGERRTLTVDATNRIVAVAWTADSQAVLIRKDPAGDVWKIPIDGSASIKLDWNVDPQTTFSVHPNGRQIAFAVAEPAKADEIWVLENFLPTSKTAK